MSKVKRLSPADEIYTNHLYGSRFKNNPGNDRLAIMERMYFRILTELAVNRFKWSGFPPSIDVRFLELTLFYHALSIFYWDDRYNQFLALKGGGNNFVNMLDNPTAFQVIGNNFVGKTVSVDNAIPIWANYLRVPDLDIVSIFATKLANIDLSIEINAKNARRTKIIASNENMRLSTQNINRQIDEGQSSIAVSGPLSDLEFIQALDLGVNPDTIVNLHILRTRLWNECMGLLGIENANQDKKERLVADEVSANDDQTNMMRYVNLNARRLACDQINTRYGNKGLNVSVEYRTDADKAIEASNETESDETVDE